MLASKKKNKTLRRSTSVPDNGFTSARLGDCIYVLLFTKSLRENSASSHSSSASRLPYFFEPEPPTIVVSMDDT